MQGTLPFSKNNIIYNIYTSYKLLDWNFMWFFKGFFIELIIEFVQIHDVIKHDPSQADRA